MEATGEPAGGPVTGTAGTGVGEAGTGRSRGRTVWLVVGIALLAINLRPAVVAVAPLTSAIRAGTALSSAGVSLLTTLPVLCFGAFAAVAPRLGRALGLERALAVAIVCLIAGTALRLVPGTALLYLGSILAGAGIAIENVLLSGLIKRDFPHRVGVMMGLYTVMLSGGASAAAGLTLPLGDAVGGGWRTALALWGVLAAVAAVVWLPISARRAGTRRSGSPAPDRPAPDRPAPDRPASDRPAGDGPASDRPACGSVRDRGRRPPPTARVGHAAPAAAGHGLALGVWRTPLAWWIAGYMASQSLVYYSLNAWLPSLLHSHGVSSGTAGAMLAVFNLTGIVTSVSMPAIAVRLPDQRRLVGLLFALFGIGILGLMFAAGPGAWVWMVVLGLGQGTGISLGLTLFVLRTRSPSAVAELSGMAQTVGYLLAALGPLTVGALHGATGGWTASLIELLAVTAVILVAGWAAGSARTLEPGAPLESGAP